MRSAHPRKLRGVHEPRSSKCSTQKASDEASGLDLTLVGFLLAVVADRDAEFRMGLISARQRSRSNPNFVARSHGRSTATNVIFLAAARCALRLWRSRPQKPVLFDFDGDGDRNFRRRARRGDEGHYARNERALDVQRRKKFLATSSATTSTQLPNVSAAMGVPTFESLQDTKMGSSRAHRASNTTGHRPNSSRTREAMERFR